MILAPNAATVLVTGGLGFIGRHVSRHFRSHGNRVIGMGHGGATESEISAIGLSRWCPGDVSRRSLEDLAESIELIVHCAGSSLVGDSFRDPDAEFHKSVGAAVEVLEFAARQVKRPRVVVLSSAAVYGVIERLPIGEDAPLNPISPYGKSKLAIEERCRHFGLEHGVQIAIVRLFSVYGLGLRKQLFWDACRKLSKGDGCFAGSGDERRDWLHVADAVRLIDASVTQASTAVPVVNGGSGISIKVREALFQVRSNWSASAPTITFSGEVRAGDPPGYEADITRARSFGWTPNHDFRRGLADYVAWARNELMA